MLPRLLQQCNGNLEAVRARLRAWQALHEQTGSVDRADLDGDGRAEALLRLCPPSHWPPGFLGPHALAVLQEGVNGWELLDSKAYDGPLRPLIVPMVRDMTGEGKADVVVTFDFCGVHTCIRNVDVLAVEAGHLRSLLEEPLTMPTGDVEIKDRDGDGRWEIALHGGEFGSAGAGRVQTRTDIYSWDGRTFALTETLWDPSPFRVHVFHDGDRALRRGDLRAAIACYQQVVTNPGLAESRLSDRSEAEDRRDLEAFAHYRLVTVHAALGDRNAAEEALQTLKTSYADHPCLALAEAFWKAWQADGNASAGCRAAQAHADAHPEAIGAFGDYGYGNPTFTAEDICFLE